MPLVFFLGNACIMRVESYLEYYHVAVAVGKSETRLFMPNLRMVEWLEMLLLDVSMLKEIFT